MRPSNRRSTSDKTGQGTRARHRAAILARFGAVCVPCLRRGVHHELCGIDLTLAWPDPGCFTRDHIVPRSLGGTDDIENLCGAHKVCNESRGNKG